MSMSESLSQWLDKRGIEFKPDESYALCRDVLKQEGENLDACINLAYAFEMDTIDEDTFTMGLCEVTGHDMQKLLQIIKGEDDAQKEETTETIQPEGTGDNEELGTVLSEIQCAACDMEPSDGEG